MKTDDTYGRSTTSIRVPTTSAPIPNDDTIRETQAVPNYDRRLVKCSDNTCNGWTDTTAMQMRNHQGYRNIVCRGCNKQSRTQNWCCECGIRWHKCQIHRIDPATHQSRRRINGIAAAKENRELLPTDRPKPLIKDRPRRAQKVRNVSSFIICTAQLNVADTQLSAAHHISRAECPKLAAKLAESIPHRFTVTQDDKSDDAREHVVS